MLDASIIKYSKLRVALTIVLICAFIASSYSQAKRNNLTGQWGGVRDSLQKNGIVIKPRVTFFNQNFVAGEGDNKSVFAGKADLDVKLDGRKIGLPRWTLAVKFEQNFGDVLAGTGNVMLPKNTAMTFPGFNGTDASDVTSFYIINQFGEANVLMVGKINMIDLAASTRYTGGAGIEAFWNVGFAAPISGITPPYIFGAVSVIKTKALKYTFMVYDPESAVNKSGLESPFNKGVVLSASFEKEFKIAGKSGSHVVRVAYSTQDGTDLYDLGDIFFPVPPPDGGFPGTKNSRYYVSYSINQPIVSYKDKSGGWGFFGQVGFSDGNPTPVNFSMLGGIGGNGFIKQRRQDKWGVAFYEYSLSNAVDEFSSAAGIPLRNEKALEIYYDLWLSNYISLGGDIQWTKPIVKSSSNAVFLGLRSSIRL